MVTGSIPTIDEMKDEEAAAAEDMEADFSAASLPPKGILYSCVSVGQSIDMTCYTLHQHQALLLVVSADRDVQA